MLEFAWLVCKWMFFAALFWAFSIYVLTPYLTGAEPSIWRSVRKQIMRE